MKRKPNPRPPKRSPLQPAPFITCPKCEQPITLPYSQRYGAPVDTGNLASCNHCKAALRCVRVRAEVHWQWEVYS